MNIEDLRLMNDSTILYLKKMNQNCLRNEIIKRILKDETCFFKMNQEDAYIILEDIGVSSDKIPSLYTKLTSYDIYKKFVTSGKMKIDDPELVIRHFSYNPNELFKNKSESSKTISNFLKGIN